MSANNEMHEVVFVHFFGDDRDQHFWASSKVCDGLHNRHVTDRADVYFNTTPRHADMRYDLAGTEWLRSKGISGKVYGPISIVLARETWTACFVGRGSDEALIEGLRREQDVRDLPAEVAQASQDVVEAVLVPPSPRVGVMLLLRDRTKANIISARLAEAA